MIDNYIDCDVHECEYNVFGKGCCLHKVRITTDCTKCTCCDSFKNKNID